MDLHILTTLEYEEWFLEWCLFMCFCTMLTPEWLDIFYLYSVFKIFQLSAH
jgi:hypothetical protein